MRGIKKNFQELIDGGKGSGWIAGTLFICNLADASIIPLPAQTILLIAIFARQDKTIKYLTASFLGAISGAIAAYLMGWLAAGNSMGETSPLLRFLFDYIPGFSESTYHRTQVQFSELNLWMVITASLAPVPYGFFAVASGIFRINIVSFLIITLLTQAIKFYGVTFITAKIGKDALLKAKKYFRSITTFGIIFLIISTLVY